MVDDFCASSEYAELTQGWRTGELTARELAEAFSERDETCHGYVWLLIAADLGDEDAADTGVTRHQLAARSGVAESPPITFIFGTRSDIARTSESTGFVRSAARR